VTKRLDPARNDAGVRLRAARLRRGMTQTTLANLACVSTSLVSMIETGQRPLRSADYIFALADVLRVSPRFLIDGNEEPPAPGQPTTRTVPFPARCDPITLAHHQQLADRFIHLANRDRRTAGDWLRRLAREPGVHPWLLLDQLATVLPQPRSSPTEMSHP
jgi:transcriptional regulator with XRE-family HTH domain